MIPHASMIFRQRTWLALAARSKLPTVHSEKRFTLTRRQLPAIRLLFMKSHDNMFTVTCNRLSCIYGKDRIDFTEPLALYAARHRFSDSSETAYRRCAEAYSLMAQENYHEAGLPALIGFYIDCHMPAVNFKGSIQHLYMHNLAPEHSSDFPECTYPCNSFIKEAYKAWHCHTYHEVMDVSIKLMRKGGPSPSSVRYVSGLLHRCSTKNSPTEKFMRNMFVTHILKNHKHCTNTADPATRRQVYNTSTQELCEKTCASLTTKQLHELLSCHVATCTTQNDALSASIGLKRADKIKAMNYNPLLIHSMISEQKHITIAYDGHSVMLKALGIHMTKPLFRFPRSLRKMLTEYSIRSTARTHLIFHPTCLIY